MQDCTPSPSSGVCYMRSAVILFLLGCRRTRESRTDNPQSESIYVLYEALISGIDKTDWACSPARFSYF